MGIDTCSLEQFNFVGCREPVGFRLLVCVQEQIHPSSLWCQHPEKTFAIHRFAEYSIRTTPKRIRNRHGHGGGTVLVDGRDDLPNLLYRNKWPHGIVNEGNLRSLPDGAEALPHRLLPGCAARDDLYGEAKSRQ